MRCADEGFWQAAEKGPQPECKRQNAKGRSREAEGVGLVTSDGALSDDPVQMIW
jgi:hypothetical protein